MFSIAGVIAARYGAPDSPPLATATVLAVATAAAMHARLAMGRWRAAAQIVIGAALLALIAAPPRLVGTVLIAGLAGAGLIARRTRRSAVLRAGVWTGLLAGAVMLSGLAANVTLPDSLALREALGAALGGFASAPLLLTLGPVAERVFGHRTRLTLSEWLNYDQPLLRRLATTAPGTFQHSVNVGLLADAAAGAIGGDALLARVGGLYHDVGKMRAPGYFIENQEGPNPHDGMDPWDSARILRAHVLDGVELIRAHRMGDRIVDFVLEHHGRGLMRLLRDKAAAMGQGEIDDDTYRYPGPSPRSRETAVVMIADQLEATARSSPPADAEACGEMVRQTIARIRDEGHLQESGLTERHFAELQPAISRALQAMYHRRLTYPSAEAAPPLKGFLSRVMGRSRTGR